MTYELCEYLTTTYLPKPIEKSIKKIVEDAKCDTQAFVSKDNAKNIIASEIS